MLKFYPLTVVNWFSIFQAEGLINAFLNGSLDSLYNRYIRAETWTLYKQITDFGIRRICSENRCWFVVIQVQKFTRSVRIISGTRSAVFNYLTNRKIYVRILFNKKVCFIFLYNFCSNLFPSDKILGSYAREVPIKSCRCWCKAIAKIIRYKWKLK
jgi:hypothetical protein